MDIDLYKKISNIRAIDTHSHHMPDNFFFDLDLDCLLQKTYVAWSGAKFDASHDSRQKYLEQVRYKSYFVWLQRSLKQLYHINEDLTADYWDHFSEQIRRKHKDISWHKSVLKDQCGYEKVIIDAYWSPGSRNDDKELFTSTFRIDPLFFGYSKEALDHDGNNVFTLYEKTYDDLDSYLAFVRQLIAEKVKSGCVALKNAIAYDRNLEFAEVSKTQASRIFEQPTKENVKYFQDYLFYEVCALAAELSVPVQCHTGLGCIDRTNAIHMREIIRKNPDTRFVLFHGGFLWSDDILALLHVSPNVYTDICWLPLVSPTVAEQTLHALIEIGTSDKICWGCDTWTSEESLGARLAVNSVMEKVLGTKISSGYINRFDAEQIAENILYNNAKKLYAF